MNVTTLVRCILGLDDAEDVRADAKQVMREISHRSRNEATVAIAAAKETEKATNRSSEKLADVLQEQKNTLRQTEVSFLRRIRGEE